MQTRVTRQAEFDAGKRPGFLPQTKHIREEAAGIFDEITTNNDFVELSPRPGTPASNNLSNRV